MDRNDWIPCRHGQKKPALGVRVLGWKDGLCITMRWVCIGGCAEPSWRYNNDAYVEDVTHWQPCPEEPLDNQYRKIGGYNYTLQTGALAFEYGVETLVIKSFPSRWEPLAFIEQLRDGYKYKREQEKKNKT